MSQSGFNKDADEADTEQSSDSEEEVILTRASDSNKEQDTKPPHSKEENILTETDSSFKSMMAVSNKDISIFIGQLINEQKNDQLTAEDKKHVAYFLSTLFITYGKNYCGFGTRCWEDILYAQLYSLSLFSKLYYGTFGRMANELTYPIESLSIPALNTLQSIIRQCVLHPLEKTDHSCKHTLASGLRFLRAKKGPLTLLSAHLRDEKNNFKDGSTYLKIHEIIDYLKQIKQCLINLNCSSEVHDLLHDLVCFGLEVERCIQAKDYTSSTWIKEHLTAQFKIILKTLKNTSSFPYSSVLQFKTQLETILLTPSTDPAMKGVQRLLGHLKTAEMYFSYKDQHSIGFYLFGKKVFKGMELLQEQYSLLEIKHAFSSTKFKTANAACFSFLSRMIHCNTMNVPAGKTEMEKQKAVIKHLLSSDPTYLHTDEYIHFIETLQQLSTFHDNPLGEHFRGCLNYLRLKPGLIPAYYDSIQQNQSLMNALQHKFTNHINACIELINPQEDGSSISFNRINLNMETFSSLHHLAQQRFGLLLYPIEWHLQFPTEKKQLEVSVEHDAQLLLNVNTVLNFPLDRDFITIQIRKKIPVSTANASSSTTNASTAIVSSSSALAQSAFLQWNELSSFSKNYFKEYVKFYKFKGTNARSIWDALTYAQQKALNELHFKPANKLFTDLFSQLKTAIFSDLSPVQQQQKIFQHIRNTFLPKTGQCSHLALKIILIECKRAASDPSNFSILKPASESEKNGMLQFLRGDKEAYDNIVTLIQKQIEQLKKCDQALKETSTPSNFMPFALPEGEEEETPSHDL